MKAGGLVQVSPKHEYLVYSGRIDFSHPETPVFIYPGSFVRMCFTGDHLAVKVRNRKKKEKHELLLFKRQDGCHCYSLYGFELGADGCVCPSVQNPQRRMEVYGDSESGIFCIPETDAGHRDMCAFRRQRKWRRNWWIISNIWIFRYGRIRDGKKRI